MCTVDGPCRVVGWVHRVLTTPHTMGHTAAAAIWQANGLTHLDLQQQMLTRVEWRGGLQFGLLRDKVAMVHSNALMGHIKLLGIRVEEPVQQLAQRLRVGLSSGG